MLIFGINLPLPELFLVLVLVFLFFLVMILMQLQKLQKLTVEEQKDLEELERMEHDQMSDIDEIKRFEEKEAGNLLEFQKGIADLEEDTDTIYLKRLAPDLYKIQNYTLWALSKNMAPSQIKQNLLSRGWKDNKMIAMIIEDTLKYTGHIKKGDIDQKEPVASPEGPQGAGGSTKNKSIQVVETTHIIKPVRIVTMKETTQRRKSKKKPKKSTKKARVKKSKDDFRSIEKELSKLEKDLKKPGKKSKSAKKPKAAPSKKKQMTKRKI
ncbi:MAG: hypothetical protein ABIJ34_07445 [archaeon]